MNGDPSKNSRSTRQTVASARAEAQAESKRARAERKATSADDGPVAGAAIVRTSVIGTVLFGLTAVIAATVGYDPDTLTPAMLVATGVALGLFAIGSLLFLVALFVAAQRSRESEISVGSMFFLADVAPPIVRVWLLGSLAAQVVIGVATAASRPFSPLAFGTLVPMFGLGLAGLWGARHGTFPERKVESRSKKR
jgi:hypothetical protein